MRKRIFKRTVTLMLTVALLLPLILPVNAVSIFGLEAEVAENLQLPVADTSNSIEVLEKLTENSQILRYVDESVFRSNKHVARLANEEKLNSFVFLNSDGTKTAYYMDEAVKFIDINGEIKEKNVNLNKTLDGYVTIENSIELTLPIMPKDGIQFSHGGYNIRLTPEGGSNLVSAQKQENKVVYNNYYGKGMSLVYTPTLSGVKEDILLDNYYGVKDFAFLLDTDGLGLYQENGRYYLATSETAEDKIELGDVVAYDSAGHFSQGVMTAITIRENGQYRITLHANEEFLTDAKTVYPVWIDPTLTVSDSTHGAGAVQDITIYSGKPTSNCNWQYLVCGYLNSDFQIGRTLVKFPGLIEDSTYQTLGAGAITSAQFYIYEASGTAGYPINLYANAGSTAWTESTATWNSAGYAIGALYATASPGSNRYTAFDITNLVKAWLRATPGVDANAGFILQSSNESTTSKSFCSTEFSNSACMPYVVVNYQVSGSGGSDSFYEATNLVLGNSVSVNITVIDEKRYFRFVPSTTGFYNFESTDNDCDPRIWLYNSSLVLMRMQNDPSGSANFSLAYHLVANTVYYIVVGCTGTDTGSFRFFVAPATPSDVVIASTVTTSTVKTVDLDVAYKTKEYSFTPTETGVHVIVSDGETGDPIIWIYDSALSCLDMDDDDGHGLDFCVDEALVAGQKYYIVVGHSGTSMGRFNFNILPAGHLPTSGSEIDFEPNAWAGTKTEGNSANCYAYMLNNPYIEHPRGYGYVLGGSIEGFVPSISGSAMTLSNVLQWVEQDAENLGFTFEPVGKYEICPVGTYKVALVLAEGSGYHWYRQNPDGTWSHKLPEYLPKTVDASGQVIYDPEVANRDYWNVDYDVFGGFYCVTPFDASVFDD